MFRFLTITMAVCLFVQDAQAAVASNTLREVELMEEELLRALEMERQGSGCIPVTQEICSQTACYYQMDSSSRDEIFAQVILRNDGSVSFGVDVGSARVLSEKISHYDVNAAYTSESFVINGQSYKLNIGKITPGDDETNLKVNSFKMC